MLHDQMTVPPGGVVGLCEGQGSISGRDMYTPSYDTLHC